jgi:hypothetical protein
MTKNNQNLAEINQITYKAAPEHFLKCTSKPTNGSEFTKRYTATSNHKVSYEFLLWGFNQTKKTLATHTEYHPLVI